MALNEKMKDVDLKVVPEQTLPKTFSSMQSVQSLMQQREDRTNSKLCDFPTVWVTFYLTTGKKNLDGLKKIGLHNDNY